MPLQCCVSSCHSEPVRVGLVVSLPCGAPQGKTHETSCDKCFPASKKHSKRQAATITESSRSLRCGRTPHANSACDSWLAIASGSISISTRVGTKHCKRLQRVAKTGSFLGQVCTADCLSPRPCN